MFGERLIEERAAAGLSRRELARRAGLSEATLREYEAGQIGVMNDGATRLAAALGVGMADMVAPLRLFDVEFASWSQASADGVGRIAHEGGRAYMWPAADDGRVRVRASTAALIHVIGLGAGDVKVSTVEPTASLVVEVAALGQIEARRLVLGEATRVDCCPPITMKRRERSWVAMLLHVPEQCSMALQRLAPSATVGLFVPA